MQNIKQILGKVNTEIPSFLKNFDRRKGRGRNFDPKIRSFFLYILSTATPGATFEVSPPQVASRFGVSERTIRNWLAFFVRNHWIIPVDRKGGRGHHPTFRLFWGTQFEKAERKNLNSIICCTAWRGYDVSKYRGRVEVLKALPDDLILIKGRAYYRWVMETIRRTVLKACPWVEKEVADVICGFLGELLAGKSMKRARRLVRWLAREVHTIVLAVRDALRRGLRNAFRCIAKLLKKGGVAWQDDRKKRNDLRKSEGRWTRLRTKLSENLKSWIPTPWTSLLSGGLDGT